MRRPLALILALASAAPASVYADEIRAAPDEVTVPRSASADAMRAAQPELALPVVYEQGRVTVRAEAGLESQAAAIAAHADSELASIAMDLQGLPVPEVAEIRLVYDAAELARAAPPGAGAPPWASGVAYPAVGVVVVATYRGPSSIDVMHTVDHELAHLALGAALGDAAPRWLHEGFAYVHSTEWSWDRAQTLAGMAWFNSTIPLDQLEQSFPAEELPASRAYAESYDFVSFLARRGRWADASDDGDRYPFQQFLAETARTGDVDVAAQRAFGRPLKNLFGEWESDLESRYMFMPLGILLGSLWLLAVVLLILGWRRRRRLNARRLAEWERQEQAARDEAARHAAENRLVPAIPIWGGPRWAPPGATVEEPPDDDLDVRVDDDDDERPGPPPIPPVRTPN